MEMGKFPWEEIIGSILPTIMGYFAGRYRKVYKKGSK